MTAVAPPWDQQILDQLVKWLNSIPLGTALLWVVGAIVLILAIWKGWPVFRKFVRSLSNFVKLVDTLGTLPVDIAFIKHELDDNSGGSVKDAVKRTEKAVADLSTEVTHIRGQAASLKTSVQKTNRRLDEMNGPVTVEVRRGAAAPQRGETI